MEEEHRGGNDEDGFKMKWKPMPGAVEMFRQVYDRYGDRCGIDRLF